MTKLRLQNQHGSHSGRSSPKTALARPSSALSDGRGGGGGLGHDRAEWRHSLVADEMHRGVLAGDDVLPSAGMVR